MARLRRLTSSMHVLERRDGELDRQPRGQAQLVDPVDVVGVGERDPERVLVDRVGDRADPLEHGERHELGRLGRDAGHRQVDERQPVALGELPGPVEVVDLLVLDVGDAPAEPARRGGHLALLVLHGFPVACPGVFGVGGAVGADLGPPLDRMDVAHRRRSGEA